MSKREPERPRKKPVQSRSKMLYASILEAGADILRDSEAELTVDLLCERVGISVGSLYQYFPSKEAVLSEIFRTVVEEEWLKVRESIEQGKEADFEEALQLHASAGVEFIRRIYSLDPDFYRKYGDNYLPYTPHETDSEKFNGWSDQVEQQYISLVRRHPKAVGLSDREIEQIAFIYGRGSVSLMRMVVEERPEYIHDDRFMAMLARLFSLGACFE